MSKKKFPPLTPGEVETILQRLGFSQKNQRGSHRYWERAATETMLRKVVTVDQAVREFADDLMKSMVQQSGFSRDEFYAATKTTARKAGLQFNPVKVSAP